MRRATAVAVIEAAGCALACGLALVLGLALALWLTAAPGESGGAQAEPTGVKYGR